MVEKMVRVSGPIKERGVGKAALGGVIENYSINTTAFKCVLNSFIFAIEVQILNLSTSCSRGLNIFVHCPTTLSGWGMALRCFTLFPLVTVSWDSGRKLEQWPCSLAG